MFSVIMRCRFAHNRQVKSILQPRFYSKAIEAPLPPKKASFLKKTALATTTLVAASALTLYAFDPTLPKRLNRNFQFWKSLFPIYLHYRFLQWKLKNLSQSERQAEYEKLHEIYAPRVLETILRLRGIYIKMGQVGVTREDLLPKRYRDELKILLDSVPALSGDQVHGIVKEAMGCESLDEVFTDFDDKAYGAASIGQVHKAKWKKTGEDVIIKVKYPDSYDLFEADMKTMKQFVNLAQPEQAIIMDEMERQFLKEFDFKAEGDALARVKASVEPAFPNVVVPKPIFYNRDIIVMQYLDGVKLIDAVMDEYKQMANRMGITLDELIERGKTMPKPTVTDKIFQTSWYMVHAVYRHTTSMVHYSLASVYNSTLGWVAPAVSYPKKLKPIVNPPALFDTIVKVHGHQIFNDGFFNGDPHPGNILLLSDGKIGLIDFGQTKSLTKEQVRTLSEMMIYIADDDKEKIVDTMFRLGFKSVKSDREVAYLNAKIAFDRDDKEFTGGLSFFEFIEELDRRDRALTIPEDFVMAVRVAILIRGIGQLLKQPPLSIAKAWKPFAEQNQSKK